MSRTGPNINLTTTATTTATTATVLATTTRTNGENREIKCEQMNRSRTSTGSQRCWGREQEAGRRGRCTSGRPRQTHASLCNCQHQVSESEKEQELSVTRNQERISRKKSEIIFLNVFYQAEIFLVYSHLSDHRGEQWTSSYELKLGMARYKFFTSSVDVPILQL